MRTDVEDLKITDSRFEQITGIKIDRFRNPGVKIAGDFIVDLFYILFGGSFIIFPIIYYLICHFFGVSELDRLLGNVPNWLFYVAVIVHIGISVIISIIIAIITNKLLHRKLANLRKLFLEVENYNQVLKAIDIKDQLEDAGNQGINLKDRARVLEALKLTREDLIRALKTEKIFRDNKDFIDQNPAIFTSNLASVRALQISDKASEWSHLLNQTLQVAVEVQEEMQRFQNHN